MDHIDSIREKSTGMDIKIVHNSQTPIYMQIRNQIKTMILTGELLDGFMLPSERAMAKTAGVHRNTIIKAYNELKADGLIEARQGLGYSISYQNCEEDPTGQCGNIPWLHLIKDEFAVMEDSFENFLLRGHSGKIISFAGGIVPGEAYNQEDIKEILSEMIASDKEEIFSYAPYQGIYHLRSNLSAFLREKGINAQPGEIQILSETNQVLDYLVELMIKPGDAVITEEPVSPDVIRELQLAGAKVITVPLDSQGMIVEGLEPIIIRHSPKFIYVNSSFHDPTGIIMSVERRHELLNLANRHRIPIIEDDCASGIRYDEHFIPSLKSLDKCGRVIYIYSFALTFAPGVRLAFAVAPRPVVKRLSYLVSMHLMSIDSLSQKLMSIYLEKGMYQKNLKAICVQYKRKRDLMCEKLEEARTLGVEFAKPAGGIYIWCRLPENMSLKLLIRKSIKSGVAFIPGNVFFPYGSQGASYIRLNYSYPSEQQIAEGMKLLIQAMKDSIR